MELNFTNAAVTLTFILTILGWAYQLGRGDARLSRNEHDIVELRRQREDNARDLRTELRESFDKVYRKIDELPCHSPAYKKDICK